MPASRSRTLVRLSAKPRAPHPGPPDTSRPPTHQVGSIKVPVRELIRDGVCDQPQDNWYVLKHGSGGSGRELDNTKGYTARLLVRFWMPEAGGRAGRGDSWDGDFAGGVDRFDQDKDIFGSPNEDLR